MAARRAEPRGVEARFELRMNTLDAARAAEILERAGISFSPERDMICGGNNETYNDSVSGEDAALIARKINAFLDSQETKGPRLPGNDADISLEQRAEILRIAYYQILWDGFEVEDVIWKDEGYTWEETARRYRALFGAEDTGDAPPGNGRRRNRRGARKQR